MAINTLVQNYKTWFKKIFPNRPDILFPKTNNIKMSMFITILNRNISVMEGNKISVACGFDTRFDERWKLRNIKIKVVVLLNGVVSEGLMANLNTPGESTIFHHQLKTYYFLLCVVYQEISKL